MNGFPGVPRAFLLLPIAALALRLPWVGHSLPFVFHWDEPTIVNLAVWIFEEGDLNPRYFHHPAGMVYLLALLYGFVLLCGRLGGIFASWEEAVRAIAQHTGPRPPEGGVLYPASVRVVSALYVIGRAVSSILGALSVWWSVRIARRLGGDGAAWLAGLWLALNAFHVAGSTLVTTDVACAAFLILLLDALLGGASPRRAGIALGLAAAFEYAGGIGLYLWPLGLFLPPAGHTRAGWNRHWIHALPWAAGVFLALNPYAILTPGAFWSGLTYEVRHMGQATAHLEGLDAGVGGAQVVAQTLARDLGPIVLVGFVLGVALAWRARRRDSRAPGILLLGAWSLLYLAQVAAWKTAAPRCLLAIWPAFFIVAGCGYAGAWAAFWSSRRSREAASPQEATLLPLRGRARRTRPAWLALVVLLTAPMIPPLVRTVAARLRPDSRVAMGQAVDRLVPPDAVVAVEAGGPWIDPSSRAVIHTDLLGRHSPEGWRRRGVRYALATGREWHLPPGSPDSLVANRRLLDTDARVVWRQDPLVIYDLGEGRDPLSRGKRLLEAGQPSDAADLLEELTRSEPRNSAAASLLGDARLAAGDTAAAVAAYQRAAATDPEDPNPPLMLGNLALLARDYSTAVTAFLEANARAPGDAVVAYNLATALLYRAQRSAGAGRTSDAARDLGDAAGLARFGIKTYPDVKRFPALEDQVRRLSEKWGIPYEIRAPVPPQ